MREPFRIGLTGGIASGKSAVADMLAAEGAAVIDTDVIAREVVLPGQPGLGDVVAAFGEGILNPDGSLDRRALRRRIFDEPRDRQRLEALLHPRIRAETLRQADEADGPYQVIVVPLLVGSELIAAVSRVLVVDCAEATQIQRLMARDGETEEGARSILAAQSTRADRLAIADDVLVNDGTLDELADKVAKLHQTYCELAENIDA